MFLIFLPACLSFAALGCVAGFLAGLLGIGGGVVLVPGFLALFHWLYPDANQLMHVAVATSLAIIVPTGFSSARAHYKHGAVRVDLLKIIGPGVLAGALAGSFLADGLASATLKAVFAVTLVFLALIMQIDFRALNVRPFSIRRPIGLCAGAGIGGISALMGIGGATLSVPFLTLSGVSIRQAVGTASAIGFLLSVPGVSGFVIGGLNETGLPPWGFGYIHLPALAAVLPFSVLIAPLGARLAHRLPVAMLKRIFSVFILLVAARMLWAVFG